MPSPFTGRGAVRFLLRFSVAYGIALFLDWNSPVAGHLTRATVAVTARLLLPVAEATTARRFTSHETGEIHVHVSAGEFERDYDLPPVYRNNVYIFLALVVASSGLSWRKRFAALAVGGAVLLFVNGLIFLGAIWQFEARYPQLRQALPAGAWRFLAGLVYQLSPTGGAYMLPIFVWGFVLLSPVAAHPAETTKKVGRNDRCPCNSGRKYKACCGA